MIARSWKAVLFVSAMALMGQTAATTPNYILETTTGANVTALSAKYSFTVLKSWQSPTVSHYSILPLIPFSPATIKALSKETGVIEVESDVEVQAGGAETSTAPPARTLESLSTQLANKTPVSFYGSMVRASYVDQPATRIIRLADAFLKFPTGSGMVVAVIDTGVDEKHPALKNVLIPGYDFTRDLAGTASELSDLDQSTVAILDQSTVAILDAKRFTLQLNQSTVAILDQSTVAILDGKLPKSFGHGTMVAGLVHLVAPSARILPLKAFRADGSSSLSNIIRAIYYAADHGANVISMSFSFDTASVELSNAIAYAYGKGVLLVASAGNDGREKKVYPAASSHVVGVGSTNYSDQRSPFSNFGDCAKASAPGEALITTFPGNNYAGVWGTSFSAPMVAGALAVMKQINPRMSYGDAADVLEKGVRVGGDMGSRLSLPGALLACQLGEY